MDSLTLVRSVCQRLGYLPPQAKRDAESVDLMAAGIPGEKFQWICWLWSAPRETVVSKSSIVFLLEPTSAFFESNPSPRQALLTTRSLARFQIGRCDICLHFDGSESREISEIEALDTVNDHIAKTTARWLQTKKRKKWLDGVDAA